MHIPHVLFRAGLGEVTTSCCGMGVPEALMAHVDASMQENKQVSSEPSWSTLLPNPLSLQNQDNSTQTAFTHLEPYLGIGCISAT